MWFQLKTPANDAATDSHATKTSRRIAAAAVFLSVVVAGTWLVELAGKDAQAQRKVDMLTRGAALRADLFRELNHVLYLTSGLRSYLAVRHKNLQRTELESILAATHAESKHVRNLAVATGYRVTHVYPIIGNEKAVDLYYPNVPEQWPAIRRVIESGRPALIGPVDLVQGGKGLIYRFPIYIEGRYWGLLSSVIDHGALFAEVFAEGARNGLALALRRKDDGLLLWGEPGLLENPDAQIIDVEVPGGQWQLLVHSTSAPRARQTLWLFYGLVWVLAVTLGWSTLIVLSQRAALAKLALFDPLTGLPNRRLLDDRISRTLSGLARDPEKACLLMFIDLERFKPINDRHGHRAGDFALQQIGRRIASSVRETDIVGRMGGDEFVVFMENIDRNKVNELVDKIRQAAEEPETFGGAQLQVGASIGTAMAPDDGNALDELLRIADSRMYADKDARKAAR